MENTTVSSREPYFTIGKGLALPEIKNINKAKADLNSTF